MVGEMFGIVRSFYAERFIGVIVGSIGVTPRTYLFVPGDIEPDLYGRQYLLPAEKVAFVPAFRFGTNIATQCRALDRLEEEFDPDYREDGTVTRWNGRNGFAQRDWGGSVMVHSNQVITEGEITVGTRIRFKPTPPTKKYWGANEIEIYKPAQDAVEE